MGERQLVGLVAVLVAQQVGVVAWEQRSSITAMLWTTLVKEPEPER